MNIKELQKIINDNELNTYNYNLGNRGMRDNELGIIAENELWQVYQSHERGGHHIIKTFDNESDACKCLLYYLQAEKVSQENYKKFKEQERLKKQLH